jgi:ADP-heptose:LPS heptosyltransferase
VRKLDGILVSGCIGEGNLGDDLMLQSVISTLLKVLPSKRIFVRGPKSNHHLVEFCKSKNINLVDLKHRVFPKMQVIAGGSIFLANGKKNRIVTILFFNLLPFTLQKMVAKTYVKIKWIIKPESFHIVPTKNTFGIGLGIANIPSIDTSNITNLGQLSYFQKILARDIYSMGNFQKFLNDEVEIRLGTDLAYKELFSNLQQTNDINREITLIFKSPSDRESKNLHEFLIKNIHVLFGKENISIIFFSSQEKMLSLNYAQQGYKTLFYDGRNIKDIRKIINNSKIVISERLHGLILASMSNATILILGNDPKLINFFKDPKTGIPIFQTITESNFQAMTQDWFKASLKIESIDLNISSLSDNMTNELKEIVKGL